MQEKFGFSTSNASNSAVHAPGDPMPFAGDVKRHSRYQASSPYYGLRWYIPKAGRSLFPSPLIPPPS